MRPRGKEKRNAMYSNQSITVALLGTRRHDCGLFRVYAYGVHCEEFPELRMSEADTAESKAAN